MHDVAIIGAGPIGLELAAALKAGGVDYVQLDAGQVGQTISWYPQRSRFFSSPERIAICGVPLVTAHQDKATREEFLAYLRGIVTQFRLQVRTYEPVTGLVREGDGFTLTSVHRHEQRTTRARNVVFAIGDMHRPRLLHIPGEDLEHVSHYFDEPHRFFKQNLLIVGGRNSAVEAALRCHRAGAQVTMSYRGSEFSPASIKYWLLPEINSLIKHGKVRFFPQTVPTRITPTHVTLAPVPGVVADTVEVPAEFVLLLTGYVMDTSLLERAGVELAGENRGPVFDKATMQTSVPGLFVAGTAAAGTQVKFRLFIENCHVHVCRIVRAITGKDPVIPINPAGEEFTLPES